MYHLNSSVNIWKDGDKMDITKVGARIRITDIESNELVYEDQTITIKGRQSRDQNTLSSNYSRKDLFVFCIST